MISGVVLATACSAVAAAALYRLGGPWAAVAWLFAPTAVFTMVPYTESMFCAAAFWAWERARSDRWLAAAVLTAVACTVRVSGLFLIGALLVMILYRAPARWTSDSPWRQAASRGTDADSGVGDHGVRGVPVCSYRELDGLVPRTGDRLGARADLALAVLLEHVPAIVPGAYANHPWWAAVFRGEIISMAVGVGVTVWCIVVSLRARRSPMGPDRPMWGEASWVGVQVLAFSMSYWFFSVNRATLLWFPLWIMLGRWVAGPSRLSPPAHRLLVAAAFTVEIVLMLWWSWLFFTGHWAS